MLLVNRIGEGRREKGGGRRERMEEVYKCIVISGFSFFSGACVGVSHILY